MGKFFEGKKVTIIRIDSRNGSISHYEPIECFKGVEVGKPIQLPSGNHSRSVMIAFVADENPHILYATTRSNTQYVVVENP